MIRFVCLVKQLQEESALVKHIMDVIHLFAMMVITKLDSIFNFI